MEHQSFINEGYCYEATVSGACELFKYEPLKSEIKNFGEMEIISKWFSSHQDCEEDAVNMLASFGKLLSIVTRKRYVIATKINPIHDADYDGTQYEDWEPEMVMKMYLADKKVLQEEQEIESTVMLTIKAKPKVDLAVTHTNLIPQ